MKKVVVLGAGSWGTALATVLAKNNEEVILWDKDFDKVQDIQKKRENEKFLAGVRLKENIKVTSEEKGLFVNAKCVIFSVPSQVLRGVVKKFSDQINENMIVVNTSKGIEIETGYRLSEVIKDEILGKYHKNIVVLSGPTHAEEVGKKIPTAIVAAGSLEKAREIQQLFSNSYFRVYINNDIIGVEIGASVKNVLAIANGITDGLRLGDNTKAALITRGLVEMIRFGEMLGAKKETFYGLSGMGDLVVTSISKHSRNRYVGERLGRGEKLSEILSSMHMVAEGVETVKAINKIKEEKEISMPILEGVYKILFEEANPEEIIYELMNRVVKNEF